MRPERCDQRWYERDATCGAARWDKLLVCFACTPQGHVATARANNEINQHHYHQGSFPCKFTSTAMKAEQSWNTLSVQYQAADST